EQAFERPFEPGQVLIGRFRVVREIGRGGMGIVYEAIDEKLEKKRIAIKCARSGFQGRLPPEVRLATEIAHRNVCRVFEIYTASTPNGEVDFFTMEFLEGETLFTSLARRKRRPEMDEVRDLGRQIC